MCVTVCFKHGWDEGSHFKIHMNQQVPENIPSVIRGLECLLISGRKCGVVGIDHVGGIIY